MTIHGQIDNLTRCKHYNSELDIIAIKFKCCKEFYCCIHCHEEETVHQVEQWTKEEFGEKAIFCGNCSHILTIQEYFDSSNKCPHCLASFNPRCSNHYHFYFDL